ncbi:MAG: hypothetical protein JWM14_3378 [Chitinophagaceae bacterium]|nr:hypothetical protein [Chitinophagaceae bacterium]
MKEQSDIQQQIAACEVQLLNAFGNKDISALDEIIHDSVLFILPNGLTATKTMILDNYRSGNTTMAITSSDQKINIIGNTAVVSMNLELKGKYFEQEISSQFRYLRVWKLFHTTWKVIATSGVPLNN